jgi:Undecaprenyl-phosphate glucose phosphotransferase
MRRKEKVLFGIALALTDASMVILAFYASYHVRLMTEHVNIGPLSDYVGMMIIHVVSVLLVFFMAKMYHRQRAIPHVDELYAVFLYVSIGTILAIATISFLYKQDMDYPRLMIVYAWVLTVVFVAMGRLIYSRVRWALQERKIGQDRVLLVGTGELGRMIHQKILQSPGLGYEVIGYIESGNGLNGPDDSNGHDEAVSVSYVQGAPVLGTLDDLHEMVGKHEVDEVIIALPDASQRQLVDIIVSAERGRVSIKVFPDVFQIMASEVSIDDLNGLPLLTIRDVALRGWKLTLKRAVDLVFSFVVLVIVSPFMVLVALLIKLDSLGPVFYCQERMGLDARPFYVLKFRSMRADAEASTGPVWAKPDDPRRTRLGAFIRRFSIDEFPQLINVLWGEMSLVGPRPERPVFVEQFKQQIPRYMDRHREKAGITGWAQVNGLRGDTSITERTKYDLWYIENWSLGLDFKIILRTLFRLFTDRNAY